MRLASWSLRFYRLPCARDVHWSNAIEASGLSSAAGTGFGRRRARIRRRHRYAESALGTLINLQFAPANAVTPAEQTFYLVMREPVLDMDLRIANGAIELPDVADFATLIDFKAVERFAVRP